MEFPFPIHPLRQSRGEYERRNHGNAVHLSIFHIIASEHISLHASQKWKQSRQIQPDLPHIRHRKDEPGQWDDERHVKMPQQPEPLRDFAPSHLLHAD